MDNKNINEFEAAMLDAVLEVFGPSDQLTRAQILELFGDDEDLADELITVLLDAGLIVYEFPDRIVRQDEAIAFIAGGGFSALMIEEPQTPESIQKESQPELLLFSINEEPENEVFEEPIREFVFEFGSSESIGEDESVPVSVEESPEPLEDGPQIMALQQEIDDLRDRQLRTEHRLREKEILIQTLSTQNVQLARLRLFIQILLGLIALLVISLIFRSR